MVGLSLHQEQAELPGGIAFLKHKNRHGTRRVVSTGPPACGWLRGTSRTSPGPPRRWRGPVRLQGTSARGRGFAAYLSACGGQPLHRPRCGLRQGGLRSLRSASSLPFLVTCRRQVIPSHSFAARTRACCAPRKRYCGLICALRKWLYRPPRYLARAGTVACAPGSGTLPPHPVSDLAARVNGFADQPSLACTGCPHAPPEGHWRAHPAAAPCRRTRYRTLPPLCVIERREERGCRVAPLPRGGQGGGEEPPALRRRGSGHLSAKKREDAQSGRCPAGPRLPGLIGSITV